MRSSSPIISVVVPAYNAEATLPATLEAALGQTCRDIEILVVDDGSEDATADVAEAYARRDPRVHVLRQPHGGVARARNYGIHAARGRFISPLDADDLWHPRKLEAQLEALERVPGAALAYNWSHRLDQRGAVIGSGPRATFQGRVLHRHIVWNFIGNGSTPLVATEVLRQVGFEPALHDSGRQGAEDYLMQLLVAKDHAFACAPAYLTGYRRLPGSMSTDRLQMASSGSAIYAILDDQLEGFARQLCRLRRAEHLIWEVEVHRERGATGKAATTLLDAAVADAGTAGRWLLDRGRALPRKAVRWLRPHDLSATVASPAPPETAAAIPFGQHDPWALPPCVTAPPAFLRIEDDLSEADARTSPARRSAAK